MPNTARRLAALTAALLLAGCGADDTPAPGGDGVGGRDAGFAAYRECLAQHGVTLPTADPSRGPRPSGGVRPSGGPGGPGGPGGSGFPGGGMQRPAGVDDATWQQAQQACASVQPTGRPGASGGPARRPDTAYRTCLSDRGIDVRGIDTTDPKAQAALEACKVLSPSPAG